MKCECQASPGEICHCFADIGTRVRIVDGSEAHGGTGSVWLVRNGLCLIALDEGVVWLVSDPGEFEIIPTSETSHVKIDAGKAGAAMKTFLTEIRRRSNES